MKGRVLQLPLVATWTCVNVAEQILRPPLLFLGCFFFCCALWDFRNEIHFTKSLACFVHICHPRWLKEKLKTISQTTNVKPNAYPTNPKYLSLALPGIFLFNAKLHVHYFLVLIWEISRKAAVFALTPGILARLLVFQDHTRFSVTDVHQQQDATHTGACVSYFTELHTDSLYCHTSTFLTIFSVFALNVCFTLCPACSSIPTRHWFSNSLSQCDTFAIC